MDKEKYSFEANFNDSELIFSSSNESEVPVDYTPQYGARQKPRSGSIQSEEKHLNDKEIFSIRQIYGDLDSDEINLQRTATRQTILSELESRIVDNTDDDQKSQHVFDNGGVIEDQILPIHQHGKEFNKIDPELITWQGSEDPEDPRNWDIRLKIFLLGFVSLYAMVAPMSSSMLSPAMSKISQEFDISSPVMQAMVVSIQILAWAFGPLLIAPLSEHDNIGRKLVLDISCWMSLFFNLGCAFSDNTLQMMVCRFIGGLFGCVPMNVCAGVISDLFDSHSRNAALAGYSLVPLLGPVIAPLMSGFIVDHMQWRWCFYILCIFNGTVAILATLLFKETYAPTLLKRKAQRLAKATGNSNLHTIYEITNDGETTWARLLLCMTRPIELLFTHPMVIGLGSFMAFTYGFMYLMIVTFPRIFEKQYGYSKSITGLMYLPMGIGFILGVIFWTFMVGKVYTRLTKQNHGIPKPEFRLPCLIACAVFIPVGLVWFGWSAEKGLHWIMPGIGSAIFAFGLVCVFQTIQNYLIDMNVRFAASSVAAAALFRSIFGYTFPLFASKMYAALGISSLVQVMTSTAELQLPQLIDLLKLETLEPFPLPNKLSSLPNSQFSEFTENRQLITGYISQLNNYKTKLDEIKTTLAEISQAILKTQIRDYLIPRYQELILHITEQISKLTQLYNEFLNLETIQYQLLSSTFNLDTLKLKFKKMIEKNDSESIDIARGFDGGGSDDANMVKMLSEFRKSRKLYHFRKEKLNRWQEERVGGFM
ncbi:hypothetical protein KGF56_001675 [Candida oxycetoniae]|uniref:Major facilitator superfamily (MFS) profile domain-containing protein n=1 Tax=Candida oxycetoniae TaxID=497107 RepID=A0AAI9SZJ6_9ASCO|nr:uncharacterized protein KGF56_001675 [Candida oxycetoniae]KAI3405657.2 hypothetical protein KGF56_001675 [Candida oxycetoniae]